MSRNTNIYLLICCGLLLLGFSQKGPCETLLNGCCPGTYWDTEMDACVECQPGFFAANCSRQCLYPYYGENCDEKCSCDNTTCDFRNGCEKGSTSQSISYVTHVVSSATHNASEVSIVVKKNTTSPLFISLVIGTTILGIICIAYAAVHFIERQWKRTQQKERQGL